MKCLIEKEELSAVRRDLARWRVAKRVLFAVAATLLAASLCVYDAPVDIDNGSYVGLAEGKIGEVYRPYANRMLHPLMVRAVAAMFGATPSAGHPAWWVVQFVFLAVFLCGAVALVARHLFSAMAMPLGRGRAFALSLLLLVSPLWCVWGGNPYIQDVPLAAFEVCFFMALLGGQSLIALAFLALMVLTRESSVVVAGLLFICAVASRRWSLVVGTVLTTAASMVAAAWLSRESPGNIGGMGALTYMATKAVAAGSSNLLGMPLWTDVHAQLLPWFYPDAPAWSVDVPNWVRLGRIHRIGIYAFRPWNIVHTLALWALPLVPAALALAISRRMGTLRQLARPRSMPLAVQVAAAVGLAFWLLQPFSGYSPWRYVGYAWPFAWIAVPWLIVCGDSDVAP